MSGYILCQVKKAEKPFYIENISTNIYSIEELCYYLYNNLYLVDSSLISNQLCTWLEEELDLPKLAAKLKPFIGKEAGLEEILYPVFKEINYLAYEELRTLNGRIERRNSESEEIREKQKGDALMENRMYVNAIRVYQKLLEKHGAKAPEIFAAKPLIYKVKREQPASKKQKEDLRYLLKYHKIDLPVQIDYLSRNEISRITDQIISRYGRIR